MVEIVGLDAFLRGLSNYTQIAQEEFEHASQAGMNYLRSPLREYAPERPNQRYVRTEHLQEGWDEAQMAWQDDGGASFTATMGNPTLYGPYVQGDPDQTPHQAWMHVDRWKPTSDILNDNEAEVVAFFDEAVARIVQRLGG